MTHLSWLVIGWQPAPSGLKEWGERRTDDVQDFITVFHGLIDMNTQVTHKATLLKGKGESATASCRGPILKGANLFFFFFTIFFCWFEPNSTPLSTRCTFPLLSK